MVDDMADDKKIGVGFGVMLLRNGKILLGKRHDDPAKAKSLLNGAGKWTMPGGKLKFGESFEEGAKREVLEETGISIAKVSVLCVNNDVVETAHFVTLGLHAEEFAGDAKVMEPNEITEWRWFDLSALPSPLYFPTEKVLENFRRKEFYISKK